MNPKRIKRPRQKGLRSKQPLPPPKGYSSWLDYAVATLETRSLHNDHAWGNQPQWPEGIDREDFRRAAAAELTKLRKPAVSASLISE
jgi:hypothetical protein